MDENHHLEPDASFSMLGNEELFDTYGGLIPSWGATSGYMFLNALLRDLLKKEDGK